MNRLEKAIVGLAAIALTVGCTPKPTITESREVTISNPVVRTYKVDDKTAVSVSKQCFNGFLYRTRTTNSTNLDISYDIAPDEPRQLRFTETTVKEDAPGRRTLERTVDDVRLFLRPGETIRDITYTSMGEAGARIYHATGHYPCPESQWKTQGN